MKDAHGCVIRCVMRYAHLIVVRSSRSVDAVLGVGTGRTGKRYETGERVE